MMKNKSYVGIFEYVCGILLGVMLISILLQVLFRGLLNYGLSWTEELARYAMIWLTYIGAVVSLKQGSHIAIKIFVCRLSTDWQKYTNLIANLIVLFFLLILLKASIKLSFLPIIINQVTPALRIPTLYLYSVVPICTGFMIISLVVLIAKDVRKMLKMKKGEFKKCHQ